MVVRSLALGGMRWEHGAVIHVTHRDDSYTDDNLMDSTGHTFILMTPVIHLDGDDEKNEREG